MLCRLAWLICVVFFVQEAAAAPQWAFRISFTDKTGSPSLGNPSAFLSPRALARRTQQAIAVTDADRPVSGTYTDSVLRLTSGKLHTTSRWLNTCVVLLDDSSRIARLSGRAFVSRVECVGVFGNALHLKAPADVAVSSGQAGTANKGTGTPAHYGSSWSQTTMVNGDYLHDHGFTGRGQLIAVLDLGFSGTDQHIGFDSLRARNGIVDQYNFVNANANVYGRSTHGTWSLSTMAGLMPGTYVGTAPHASYALYIVDDVDYTDALYELDNVIGAMERADSIGADIITASIGYNEFSNPSFFIYPKSELNGRTTSVTIATNMAVARGIFVVVSAGNEGGNSWDFLLTPGDADSALTVGSVNATRGTSGFSSPGPNSSGRVKPDVCLLGEGVSVFAGTNAVGPRSGTSFATPQLSGWAACLRQFDPGLTPYQLREAINRSADRYSAPSPKYGYGIPDFQKVLQGLDVADLPGKTAIQVSPNPFREKVTLTITLNDAAQVKCTVTDIAGRVVATKSFNGQPGRQQLSLETPAELSAGTYFLQTTVGSERYTNKLTRQ